MVTEMIRCLVHVVHVVDLDFSGTRPRSPRKMINYTCQIQWSFYFTTLYFKTLDYKSQLDHFN